MIRRLLFLASLVTVICFSSCESSSRMEKVVTGGYSDYRDLSDEDKALFGTVYKGEIKLTPQKVSTQVVAGLNYRFICIDDAGKEHVVCVFQPLPGSGEPEVTYVK